MSKAPPPKGVSGTELQISEVSPGRRFYRISLDRYPDALGFGKSPSRFSDPRQRVEANRFGVLYLGSSLEVCFLEAVLRDQRDGQIGPLPMGEHELYNRYWATIEVAQRLRMVDLRGAGSVIMGVPTDVTKSTSQTLARKWSLSFHEHPQQPDGILYPSRLNGHANLAIYERSLRKLRQVQKTKLIDAPRLPQILEDFKISLVPTF